MNNKRILGVIAGIFIAAIIMFLDLDGLTHEGKIFLALTLMTVVFWATQVVQSGYSSGLYIALLIIFQVASPAEVLSPWTRSIMFLIIGAYLIANAVNNSGLGMRIALIFIKKFVTNFSSIIISIFALSFILAILIPHPWPRAFIIMAVMNVLIETANINSSDAKIIGFSVFAASVPTSSLFLTADSSLNLLVVSLSETNVSWGEWFKYMGPPAILSSILCCLLLLLIFRPKEKVNINNEVISIRLEEMGKLSAKEIKTIIWLVIAVVLWLTEAIHGIDIGWVTLLVAMLMSFPVIGDVLNADDWKSVPIQVLLFLTAAMAIGSVGNLTGVNQWLGEMILPDQLPTNFYILALLIAGISMFLHMILGSVISVMGVAIPMILSQASNIPMGNLPIALIAFTAISMHYILPFHHLNILVGLGEENGRYTQSEVIKFGIPLTVIIQLVILFEVFYWQIIQLI